MYIVQFEKELLDLREELNHHPDLMTILRVQPNTDIYIHICEIAAYLGVGLDGTFTHKEILALCEKFTELLRIKRTLRI